MCRGPLSKDALSLLEASGQPWEVRPGGKHMKLFVRGRMVQVLSRGPRDRSPRGEANCLAAIRRVLREA